MAWDSGREETLQEKDDGVFQRKRWWRYGSDIKARVRKVGMMVGG
jgi:hypothetical protein